MGTQKRGDNGRLNDTTDGGTVCVLWTGHTRHMSALI